MQELKQANDRFKTIASQCIACLIVETSMERVFKKISFLLNLKGMTITDWINSGPYPQDPKAKKSVRLDELVEVLENMGIRLEADEKNILLNFCTDSMSELTSQEEIIKVAQKSEVPTG